jgi:hypothetical protein
MRTRQVPRRLTQTSKTFDYTLDYKALNLRVQPELYRVGRSEQGVLMVEPYKSEILPIWKFKTPAEAKISAQAIYAKFETYKSNEDFIGMDMARKFLQMGYTRSRRYANHRSGKKYSAKQELLPFENDPQKAASATLFKAYWQRAETDDVYSDLKSYWRTIYG